MADAPDREAVGWPGRVSVPRIPRPHLPSGSTRRCNTGQRLSPTEMAMAGFCSVVRSEANRVSTWLLRQLVHSWLSYIDDVPGTVGGSVRQHFAETASFQQRFTRFGPSVLRKRAYHRSESLPLGERHVIEVQCAGGRHAVILGQDDLGVQPSCCSCRGDNDDFVEPVDHFIASQDQYRAAFVRRSKCVPADFAAVQLNCAHPSASQES